MKQRLNSWLHDAASALVYSLAGVHAEPARPELQPPYNELTRFVLDQHARMPDYLRLPLAALTLGFDSLGCARGGRPFHHQPPAIRDRQITAWKNSRTAFRRDLIRYYESLATLGLYGRLDSEIRHPRPPAPPEAFPDRVLTDPPLELRAQIVVVGSGPGGAITACLLAEAGREVLLVEEGDYLGLGSCRPFSLEEMVQKYRNGGQTVALGANKIAYVEGRCVGGGSEINSGLYHRTPPEILEAWRLQFQLEGVAEAELRPLSKLVRRNCRFRPLPVRRHRLPSDSARAPPNSAGNPSMSRAGIVTNRAPPMPPAANANP